MNVPNYNVERSQSVIVVYCTVDFDLLRGKVIMGLQVWTSESQSNVKQLSLLVNLGQLKTSFWPQTRSFLVLLLMLFLFEAKHLIKSSNERSGKKFHVLFLAFFSIAKISYETPIVMWCLLDTRLYSQHSLQVSKAWARWLDCSRGANWDSKMYHI